MLALIRPGLIILILISLFTLSNGFCGAQSISVEAVLQKHKAKEDILLVDVRNSQEFKKFHIPGSLNIPLFALKTKAPLKSKPLVLINEGRSYKDLIAEGATLSQAGFTVSILDGGLRQWQQKKGPIEGDLLAARQIRLISPQELSAGMKYENWIFIAVSNQAGTDKPIRNAKTPLERNPVPDGLGPIHNSFSVNEKDFISKIKEIVTHHKEKDFLSLILWDEKESRYPDIERQLQAAGITKAFYLEGGLAAYRRFESRPNNPSQAISFGTRENGPPQCPSWR
ncbi:MAG: rhodanese-like domain-containing protein [Pseudomonadota bacterium]